MANKKVTPKKCAYSKCNKPVVSKSSRKLYCCDSCSAEAAKIRARARDQAQRKIALDGLAVRGKITCEHRDCSNQFIPRTARNRFCNKQCRFTEVYKLRSERIKLEKAGIVFAKKEKTPLYKPVDPFFLKRGKTFDSGKLGSGCCQITGGHGYV